MIKKLLARMAITAVSALSFSPSAYASCTLSDITGVWNIYISTITTLHPETSLNPIICTAEFTLNAVDQIMVNFNNPPCPMLNGVPGTAAIGFQTVSVVNADECIYQLWTNAQNTTMSNSNGIDEFYLMMTLNQNQNLMIGTSQWQSFYLQNTYRAELIRID